VVDPPRTSSGRTVSPLRQARLDLGATLEQVCAGLDQRSSRGDSGVTPSMLSGWELGRHVTSARYRRMLAGFYRRPVDQLFAHQDERLSQDDRPQLLVGHRELYAAMSEIARGARDYLALTGSRSRHAEYLRAVEDALAERPDLIHYRVLFGPPHHDILHEHLLRLVALRDPSDRTSGCKTLHLGIIDDIIGTPERFLCVSERAAVVPIPSLSSAEGFDSGLRLGAHAASRYIDHIRQCYAGARRIESFEALRALPVLRHRKEA
jgi:transcriptional regulator with XRE-family HTH domain